jgi:ABC-type glycerol-3-phosphate transport system substrate-binding protein
VVPRRDRRQRLLIGLFAVILSTAGCAAAGDGRITLTVGTFGEFGYGPLYREYEAAHPGIKIVERVTRPEDHHKNLAAHLARKTGAADIEAIEEGWMGQFTAAPNRFLDFNAYGGRRTWRSWTGRPRCTARCWARRRSASTTARTTSWWPPTPV